MLAELRDADPGGGGLPRHVERELAAYLRSDEPLDRITDSRVASRQETA
jgi:hypothetical protein